MNWLVLTYSLPSNKRSSPRVALWRRLGRLGAISPRGGVHILPAREDCLESFQWLVKEVQQQDGDCLLMKVESFEGLTDQELMKLFIEKNEKEYAELEEIVCGLEKAAKSKSSQEDKRKLHAKIEKLRKKHAEIARTDFFEAPVAARISSKLARLERSLAEDGQPSPEIARASIKDFQKKVWVTRPHPHVDRLACIWLIKRFIDSDATIHYSPEPRKGEVGFDMKEGGTFGHVGNFCTFETMLTAFELTEPGLLTVAEIVHEIDLRDGLYLHPETDGINSVLKGWLLRKMSDAELELHGVALFEGLFQAMQRHDSSRARRGKKSG